MSKYTWAVEHALANPGHTAIETLENPGSCETCGERSPAYSLKDALFMWINPNSDGE